MAPQNEIAKASITVEANVDVAKASITDLKTDVEGLGVAADTTGAKMDSSFVSIGGSIKNATGAAQKFVGTLTSTVGIATGLIAVVAVLAAGLTGLKALFDALSNGDTGSADKMAGSLDKLADSARGVDESIKSPAFAKLAEDIEKAQKELEKAQENVDRASLLGSEVPVTTQRRLVKAIKEEKELREKQNIILEAQRTLKKQIAEDEQRAADAVKQQAVDEADLLARTQRRSDAYASLISLAEDLNIALIGNENEQIEALAEKRKRALIKSAKEAGFEEGESQLQIALELIDKTTRKQIQDNKDIAADKKRLADQQSQRDLESDKKRAEAFAKSMEQAMNTALGNLSGSFGNTITTRLDTLVTDMGRTVDLLTNPRR